MLHREVQGEALTGETDGPAIEPRNNLDPECRRFLFDGTQKSRVRYCEHLRARRSRRGRQVLAVDTRFVRDPVAGSL